MSREAPLTDRSRHEEGSPVTLVPVGEADFERFRRVAIDDYADECVLAGRWNADEAPARSERETSRFFPEGKPSPGNTVMDITSDGSHLGYIWWTVVPENPEEAFVCLLYIEPESRRKGFGTAALVAAEREMRAAGFRKMGLHVFSHNDRAVRLYRRHGLTETDIVMSKTLVAN